jgi:hypothetical protein
MVPPAPPPDCLFVRYYLSVVFVLLCICA